LGGSRETEGYGGRGEEEDVGVSSITPRQDARGRSRPIGGAEESQVMGSKCKEIAARDEEGQQPSKKAKEKQQEKYCGGATVKMGGANVMNLNP